MYPFVIFTVTIFLLFTGCSVKYEHKPHISQANLQEVSWEQLPNFEQDNLLKALAVFQKGCTRAQNFENLQKTCEDALESSSPQEFFKSNFTPYLLLGNDGEKEGLITGYYEPILKGSLTKSEKYPYPIYQKPHDIVTIDLSDQYEELAEYRLRGRVIGNRVIPYSSREQIENSEDDALVPICFVEDKVERFFMQIQGSGKVKLEDGTILNVGYAEQNGWPYYAIGRKLIEDGHIPQEDISLQSIKGWLEQNPKRVDEILNLNQSYIFFQKSEKGATGSLGVELVANRNLAVDRKYIPLGFPVFIDTTNPLDNTPIQQLMVAADTGGAIKGEIRADFFFGTGEVAKELAGKMKQKGKLFILIPNIIKDIPNAHNQ